MCLQFEGSRLYPEFTGLGTWRDENKPQHVVRCTILMTETVWKMVVSWLRGRALCGRHGLSSATMVSCSSASPSPLLKAQPHSMCYTDMQILTPAFLYLVSISIARRPSSFVSVFMSLPQGTGYMTCPPALVLSSLGSLTMQLCPKFLGEDWMPKQLLNVSGHRTALGLSPGLKITEYHC